MKKEKIMILFLFMVILSTLTYATLYTDDIDLLGYWNLDDSSTTINDNSPRNNDGVYNGVDNLYAGLSSYSSNSIFFDNSDDFINIDMQTDLNTMTYNGKGFAFGFWFNTSTKADKNINGNLRYDGANWFGFGTTYEAQGGGVLAGCKVAGGGTSADAAQITTNPSSNYFHFVCVVNSSGVHVYRNGTYEASDTVWDNGGYATKGQPLMIGKYNASTGISNYIVGQYDEVFLINRSINSDEILDIYLNGIVSTYFGLPATPIIVNPTPIDGYSSSVNVTLNVTHSTEAADVRYYLYFGNTSTLTEDNLYLINSTRTGVEYKSFTTNVTNGTYYYKWKVQNITNGKFSQNTTQRTLIIDTLANTIKIYFWDENSNTLINGEQFSVYLEGTGFSNTYSTSSNPYITPPLSVGLYNSQIFSANYPKRQFFNINVVNTTTANLNAYLINITIGVAKAFYVRGSSINALEGVNINFYRIINGTSTLVAQETTDYDGAATLYLDESYEYTINFSKNGYNTKIISLEPTENEYIFTLIGSTEEYNMSVYEGVRYIFSPSDIVLNNKTNYNFTFTLNSSAWALTNCTLKLYNGTTLLSESSVYTTPSCYISIEQNTGTMTNVTSEATYKIDSKNYVVTQQYSVIYTYEGQFSLKNFLDDLSGFGMAGFDSFGRMIIALLVIFAILYWAGQQIGTGYVGNEIILVIILCGLVGFFSFINFFYLDFPGIPNIAGLKKYLIFYLTLLVGGAFVVRRIKD